LKLFFSSSLNPFKWIIFICFAIVLFPDSPAPNSHFCQHFQNFGFQK
jgi:hypothetical protein